MPPRSPLRRKSNTHSYGHPRAMMRKLGSVVPAYLGPQRVAPHNGPGPGTLFALTWGTCGAGRPNRAPARNLPVR